MSDIKILHAWGDEPKVEFIKDPNIAIGVVYLLTGNEKYTITKTDEQKDAYIKSLEEQLHKEKAITYKIRSILDPYPGDL